MFPEVTVSVQFAPRGQIDSNQQVVGSNPKVAPMKIKGFFVEPVGRIIII
jgi:hypothetical protein